MTVESRKIVAIVDDDPVIRQGLKILLSSLGYYAELYASASEFVAAALITKASCLILDIQLGDATGIELARDLLSNGFRFPIIFMTGSEDEGFRREAAAVGCVDYLMKPLQTKRLMAAIAKAAGSH